jgi:hypothetical protein
MTKIKLGDIFEINTPKGKAYLHYIYKDDTIGELIRVLPGLFPDRPLSFEDIVCCEERFLIFFPLSIACKRKIVEYVGFYPADNFKKPEFMRSKHIIKGDFLVWHSLFTLTWKRQLVIKLTSNQKKLSPWRIWNDTLLIENLIENWSLENWK